MIYRKDLQELLKPTVEGLGFLLWGVEYLPQGKHSILRIYIDHSNGIGVEDCELVSHSLSVFLDVEDPIKGQYNLEVSSPGIERPLFELSHYEMFKGHELNLKLNTKIEGSRQLKGTIHEVYEDNVKIQTKEEIYTIAISNIIKAELISEPDLLLKSSSMSEGILKNIERGDEYGK